MFGKHYGTEMKQNVHIEYSIGYSFIHFYSINVLLKLKLTVMMIDVSLAAITVSLEMSDAVNSIL